MTSDTVSSLKPATTYYSVVAAYNSAGEPGPYSNQISFTTAPAPAVSVTSPTNGTTVAGPTALLLSASASEVSGTVSYVQFYSGSTYLGEATAKPYTLAWNNIPAGAYSVTATAFDTAGNSTVSTPVGVTVALEAPAAGAIQLQPNGSCTFAVTSGSAGASQTYDVWTSSDLVNWTLLQTAATTTGTFTITDTSTVGAQSRFYTVSAAQ